MKPPEPVNILLVDDQPGKLLSYEAILDELGENLIKASSGREALEHLLRSEITVVLMDVSMPELDGFELAEMIRQHPRFQRTAIIFVSAVHLTDLDRLKGYESGAVDYVSVPVIPELLRAKVRVFTDLYRKTREAERFAQDLERMVAERTAELEEAVARQIELADRLRETDRRKDEFLAQLAHELRNPLASLQNALSVMRLKPLEDPQLAWCRDLMGRQTDQLTRLVEDLLDVSRITLGKIRLRREPLDLARIIHEAVEASRPFVEARRHRLEVAVPERPLLLEGDGARLTQVVANLLNNAAKYQHDQGRIDIDVAREDGTAVVRIRDEGFGIPPELLPRIFEPFTQGEVSQIRVQGGLGLGLALVKSLVEMHGGSVVAMSGGPDRGSEFVVRLPCLLEAVAVPGEAGSVPVSVPRRILVVDDSTDAAESLALLLRLKGHTVSIAYDGPHAVELAETERPAVMFLDIGLPGMDGYEVCRRVRQRGLSETYIVAMTGYGQERDRERSREAGFDGHTVKPVAMDELLRVLSSR
ncbi:MAG: response regulator [Gemmatimonadales bacterium]